MTPARGRPVTTLDDLHPNARRALERARRRLNESHHAQDAARAAAARAVLLGAPVALVARELGVDRSTVRRWARGDQ